MKAGDYEGENFEIFHALKESVHAERKTTRKPFYVFLVIFLFMFIVINVFFKIDVCFLLNEKIVFFIKNLCFYYIFDLNFIKK